MPERGQVHGAHQTHLVREVCHVLLKPFVLCNETIFTLYNLSFELPNARAVQVCALDICACVCVCVCVCEVFEGVV
jgi:hypothetical protein